MAPAVAELRFSALMAAVGRAVVDVLYPARCVLCGRGLALLCEGCFARLPKAGGRRCDRCWSVLSGDGGCRRCGEHPVAFSRLRSLFRYEGDVRRLVHAYKFAGQSSLAPGLGRALAAWARAHGLEADALAAVPLTGRRRRQRGFNQAELLARETARELGVPVLAALRRRRFAGPQVGSAGAAERRRRVEGAFAVTNLALVQGLRILLVDDVATTGATLDACAVALLAAGARDVAALTLARED